MVRTATLLLVIQFATPVTDGAEPVTQIDWQQSYGGTNLDSLQAARQTAAGEFLLCGYSSSGVGGNKTSPAFGASDFWLVRTDGSGQKLWEQSFGGSSNDFLYAVAPTADGGCILGGESASGADGNKSSPNFGASDYWAVRLDASGNKLWEASFGGSDNDVLRGLQQTPDGGFVLGGTSSSPADGNKTSPGFGESDFWVVRLDANGNKLWDRSFGGSASETFYALELVSDGGGFLLAGDSASGASGNKTNANPGGWAMRLDANGSKLWEHVPSPGYSGVRPSLRSVQRLAGGQFLLGSVVSVYENQHFIGVFWLTLLDTNGNQLWESQVKLDENSSSVYRLASARQTLDGGYVLGISQQSTAFVVMRLDANRNPLWTKTFGGTGPENLHSLEVTSDGGFIVGGDSASAADGNKTSAPFGSYDVWVLKLADGFGLTLDLLPGNGGAVSATPSPQSDGRYPSGAVVTLTASPAPGFSFNSWTGDESSTSNPLRVAMNCDKSVTAVFESMQPPSLACSPSPMVLQAVERQLGSQNLKIWNSGGGVLNYSIAVNGPWLSVTPVNGSSVVATNIHTVSFDPSALDNGSMDAVLTIAPTGGSASPRTVPVTLLINSSVPAVQWQRSFGGAAFDAVTTVRQTLDGGYIVGGVSASDPGGTKTSDAWGGRDYWCLRLDASGNTIWEESFGGNGVDWLSSVLQTADGGFLLGGYSTSGTNGTKDSQLFGHYDFWVVRVDSAKRELWQRSFGGSGTDQLQSMTLTAEGGFLVGGESDSSNGNKTSPHFGSRDFWIVRLDANGNKLWDRSFGGGSVDVLRSLAPTTDGGFILGGSSLSGMEGNKSQANFGGFDFWIVRTDGDGNKVWDLGFGGVSEDTLNMIQQTADGGFILGGTSYSPPSGNKISPLFGNADYWVVRLDDAGTKLWERSFGGGSADTLVSVQETAGGGFLLGGWSVSDISGNKTSAGIGSHIWLVRLDADGSKVWEQSFGGSASSSGFGAMAQTRDGGFIVGGSSDVGALGNKTTAAYGGSDFWLLKLAAEWPQLLLQPIHAGSLEMRFVLRALAPGAYAVDRSTDLRAWQPWRTNQLSGGDLEISDAVAPPFDRRFYRARRLP